MKNYQKVSRISLMSMVATLGLGQGNAAFAQTAAAPAAPVAADEEQAKDIVVTGTQIRGVAPVGSSVISVNQAAMAESGLVSTNDILHAIPQISNVGPGQSFSGPVVNNSNLNVSRSNALNIRGLGLQATLTLLNGRRVPAGGSAAQLFDPSNLPAIALGSIDVVADGASAIYGSDAVAGVANLILRKDVEGLEARARYGLAKGFKNANFGLIAGHHWDTGAFMIAAEFSGQNHLAQSARAQFYDCNQVPFGFTNNCSLNAAPGNLTITGGASAGRYALPAGSGVGVTLAQLSTATAANTFPASTLTTIIPYERRFNFVFSAHQEVASGVTLWAESYYSNRKAFFYNGSPANGSLTVPSTNPYYVPAAGSTREVVTYSYVNDLGGSNADTKVDSYQLAFGTNIDLGHDLRLSAYYERNGDEEDLFRTNQVNTNLLNIALRCDVGGPCFNPFGSGGSASNIAAAKTFSGYTHFTSAFKADVFNAKLDGTLFKLSGGDVKFAIGGQYYSEALKLFNFNNVAASITSLSNNFITANRTFSRNISSGFAEIIVPLVGEDNAMPGIQKLELDIAGRYDKYNDVGDTKNPKIGLNWKPIDSLTIHGSFGTSFRAPTVCDKDPLCTPAIQQSATTLAFFPTGAGNGNRVSILGGSSSVVPETATTWSLGMDFKSASIPGLFASVNYFHIDYKNVIDTPGNSTQAQTNDPFYRSFITLTPQQLPTTTADAAVNAANAATNAANAAIVASRVTSQPFFVGLNFPSNTIAAIINGQRTNAGSAVMSGLDLVLDYRFRSGIGDLTLGATGTYVFSYKYQIVPGGPIVERVNQANYPLTFKARAHVGWHSEGFGANAFVNYTNAYSAVGLLNATQNDKVRAYATADLNLSYSTGKDRGALSDLTFSISAQNITGAAPPFALVSTAQEFDAGAASALGRQVSFEIRKKF
jgi:iron complex outermembrane recepter protein